MRAASWAAPSASVSGAFALGAIAVGPPARLRLGSGLLYPGPGYVAYNDYYGPAPVGCPGGYWARRPLYDQWGNQMGWSRPKFFWPPY